MRQFETYKDLSDYLENIQSERVEHQSGIWPICNNPYSEHELAERLVTDGYDLDNLVVDGHAYDLDGHRNNGWFYKDELDADADVPSERIRERGPEKEKVFYGGGESRYQPGKAVDYMYACPRYGDNFLDLYAETDPDPDNETGTYEELKAEILRIAEEYGVPTDNLEFMYD